MNMSILDLFNMITMLPEAGLEYLVHKMVPPGQLTKEERSLLTTWIAKNEKVDRTEVMRKILLEIDHANIKWINNPSEDEALKAVYESPYHIEHVVDPSETVQMAAAKHGSLRPGQVFKLIKNPARGMWRLIFEETPDQILTSNTDDEEFQLIAIRKKPMLIMNTQVNWVPRAQREAFEADAGYFPFLKERSVDDIWRALENNPRMIEHVENPTQEMKAYCIFVA